MMKIGRRSNGIQMSPSLFSMLTTTNTNAVLKILTLACCSSLLFGNVSSLLVTSRCCDVAAIHPTVTQSAFGGSGCGTGAMARSSIIRNDVTTCYSIKNDDDAGGYDDDGDSELFASSLAKRIEELQEKETQQKESIAQALSSRVLELQASEETSDLIASQSQIELPVISFDALLPKQTLEGRTEDPTFCRFLRDTGLGGWFVMVSLSPTTRKIRRHGVIAKIEAVDSIATGPTGTSTSSNIGRDETPTAVDFCIVGHRRCRVVGPRQNMQQRIGRWRRAYDPDCEESVLGWGPERFVDAPEELKNIVEFDDDNVEKDKTRLQCAEWSPLLVECDLDTVDTQLGRMLLEQNETIQAKYGSLLPMVQEWYELASNVKTYNNINVTASTRIRKGQPGLFVDPKALLKQVRNSLGSIPKDDPTAFCFWAAALINPLPVLGASLEIRGQLLEAPTLERRLQVLEWGLIRSIGNLKGERPI